MSCIFESNLRNNPMHNRHILRENFDGKPFIMPEDPTDGNPEEMPEAEVADNLSDAQNDIDQEKVVQIYAEKVRWPEDSDGDPDNYEEDTEDMGEKTFDDAEEVYKQLVDLGVQQDMKATGSTWWQSEVEQDYTEGWEITYTIHPQSGFTQEDIDYINGRIRGDIESPDPKFSKWDRDDDYGTVDNGPDEDELRMESCVMGSNLFGNGGYGRAILREMFGDEDIATETVRDHIAGMFDGTEELISDAEDYMTARDVDLDAPADSVSDEEWKEMSDSVIGDNDFVPEEDPNAELAAASDFADENPDVAFDDDGVPLDDEDDVNFDEIEDEEGYPFEGEGNGEDLDDEDGFNESYELHSMLTVEGEPTYQKPEVKEEPKPKAPTLTAKRNRRLRSKSRNIQLWNNKKKCFDPKYINTRFARMCDANEAIKKIGEACECGRKDCKGGCTPLARTPDYHGATTLRKAKRLKRKVLPPGQVYEDEK